MTDNSSRADADRLAIVAGLRRMTLCSGQEEPVLTPLSGGISCDIFRADLAIGAVCVKQALPRLRVAVEWHAPVERNRIEVEWLRFAAGVDSRIVPQVLGEDRATHLFVMRYLPPEHYPCWKTLLMQGQADAGFAASVGSALARIHAASASNPNVARRFDHRDFFFVLRIEPYLLHAAKAHADLAQQFESLANEIQNSAIALMHGDVSPKNILCGPDGPVFLDAETACYGDPAFDLAFCLNHLLLKCVYAPAHLEGYATCFEKLYRAYLNRVDWEPPQYLEARAAKFLPALLLARVDGKSPVEYLTREAERDFVRQAARACLICDQLSLDELLQRWRERLATR